MVSKQAGTIPAGEGGTQQVLYGEAPAPSSNPFPFYIPFFKKKVPFSYTLCWQMVPLSFHPLAVNAMSFKTESITAKSELFLDFLTP